MEFETLILNILIIKKNIKIKPKIRTKLIDKIYLQNKH